ncbi:hypothetical protein FGRMN_9579 [Fusarium graminum]|nr:hypothetical protein FGRMN_9579 [Fusarium graminum]
MALTAILSLVLTLLVNLGSCYSTFIRPPEWDPDQDADREMTNNQHYNAGEKIQVLYNTNLENATIWIWQVLEDIEVGAQLSETGGYWESRYDMAKELINDEDAVYYFLLYEPNDKVRLARSQYVNVSAPRPDKTGTVTVSLPVSSILTFSTEASSMQRLITSTTQTATKPTDSSSNDNATPPSDPKSDFELSSAATGGVAAGATIGGLLILGGIGWLMWKRLMRKKHPRPISELPGGLPQHQQPHPSEIKSELAGNPVSYPQGYARSSLGLHEAP